VGTDADEKLLPIVDAIDANNDGTVSFGEFKKGFPQVEALLGRKIDLAPAKKGTPEHPNSNVNSVNLISTRQLLAFQRYFSEMDKDKSGALDPQELKSGLEAMKNDEIMHKLVTSAMPYMDVDNDGLVSFNEFLKALRKGAALVYEEKDIQHTNKRFSKPPASDSAGPAKPPKSPRPLSGKLQIPPLEDPKNAKEKENLLLKETIEKNKEQILILERQLKEKEQQCAMECQQRETIEIEFVRFKTEKEQQVEQLTKVVEEKEKEISLKVQRIKFVEEQVTRTEHTLDTTNLEFERRKEALSLLEQQNKDLLRIIEEKSQKEVITLQLSEQWKDEVAQKNKRIEELESKVEGYNVEVGELNALVIKQRERQENTNLEFEKRKQTILQLEQQFQIQAKAMEEKALKENSGLSDLLEATVAEKNKKIEQLEIAVKSANEELERGKENQLQLEGELETTLLEFEKQKDKVILLEKQIPEFSRIANEQSKKERDLTEYANKLKEEVSLQSRQMEDLELKVKQANGESEKVINLVNKMGEEQETARLEFEKQKEIIILLEKQNEELSKTVEEKSSQKTDILENFNGMEAQIEEKDKVVEELRALNQKLTQQLEFKQNEFNMASSGLKNSLENSQKKAQRKKNKIQDMKQKMTDLENNMNFAPPVATRANNVNKDLMSTTNFAGNAASGNQSEEDVDNSYSFIPRATKTQISRNSDIVPISGDRFVIGVAAANNNNEEADQTPQKDTEEDIMSVLDELQKSISPNTGGSNSLRDFRDLEKDSSKRERTSFRKKRPVSVQYTLYEVDQTYSTLASFDSTFMPPSSVFVNKYRNC